jgi:hypothetical protein
MRVVRRVAVKQEGIEGSQMNISQRARKITIVCSVLVGIILLAWLVMLPVMIDLDQIDYAIKLRLNNKTDKNMLVLLCPLVTWSGHVVEKASTAHDWRNEGYVGVPLEGEWRAVSVNAAPRQVVARTVTEQVSLRKKTSQLVNYYLGKNVDFQNLMICVVAWELVDSDANDLFQPPYLVRTLYNPVYETGVERYGLYGEVTIDYPATSGTASR